MADMSGGLPKSLDELEALSTADGLGGGAIADLVRYLSDEDWEARHRAAALLIHVEGSEAERIAVKRLEVETDQIVICDLIEVLEETGSDRWHPVLERLLAHKSDLVRQHAWAALSVVGGGRAPRELERAAAAGDEVEGVRVGIASACVARFGERYLAPLLELLTRASGYRNRCAAAHELARLVDRLGPSARAMVRETAARQLAEEPTVAARSSIVTLLEELG